MANVILNDKHLTDIADAIRAKNGEATTYTPGAMAEAITNLPSGGGEPIVITGICDYACYGQFASDVINQLGNTISTENISSAQSMFRNSTLTHIPFEINFSDETSHNLSYLFAYCSFLEEAPIINNVSPKNINYLFGYCHRMRSLPEDFGLNWRTSGFLTSTTSYTTNLFNSCYSLRRIPTHFLSMIRGIQTSSSYHPYKATFSSCSTLDSIEGLGVATGTLTSNMFGNTFDNCSRLQNMIFKLSKYDSDSQKWVVSEEKWKNQTIDLSVGIGYLSYSADDMIVNYNSGITADKRVYDDATYQALKNDADWFSRDKNYSRYNHDSAVNTINSLPDTSVYLATQSGATNTIKFLGAAGAKTDGGAINTLTEEEIAVATAKGWTVSLV